MRMEHKKGSLARAGKHSRKALFRCRLCSEKRSVFAEKSSVFAPAFSLSFFCFAEKVSAKLQKKFLQFQKKFLQSCRKSFCNRLCKGKRRQRAQKKILQNEVSR